jgi:hypothetical protein
MLHNRCWLNNVCVSRGLKARIGSRIVNPKLENETNYGKSVLFDFGLEMHGGNSGFGLVLIKYL